MNLYAKLQQRAAEGRPVRIGLIGAGKFGSMYLAQVPRTPGVHLVGIADLSPAAAQTNLARVGWEAQRTQAGSLDEALKTGATHVGDDWRALVRHPAIDVIVECTGHPIAAVDHCLEAFAHGKHVVNVTVEADAFCGPLLARKAHAAGVVHREGLAGAGCAAAIVQIHVATPGQGQNRLITYSAGCRQHGHLWRVGH